MTQGLHRACFLICGSDYVSAVNSKSDLMTQGQSPFCAVCFDRDDLAQQGMNLEQDKLGCPMCLDLLKEPVTIPCGHSYCMSCIQRFWDAEDQKKLHSCPQCKQIFRTKPVLVKNSLLAVLVEELNKTRLQVDPVNPGDVVCDVCTGRKLKASKFCQQCLVSYCDLHLQPHYESNAFKKHKLVEPSEKLQENRCPCHDEVMRIYCRTDQQCICVLCSVDNHKGHDTVLAAAERAERENELRENQAKIQQTIQDRDKDLELLQREVEALNLSADKVVEHSEKIFAHLIHLFAKRSYDVQQQIRNQQKTEVSRVKELQDKLKQEISDLRRKHANLEKLAHTGDHNLFLQSYTSLSQPSRSTAGVQIRPVRYFDDVTAAMSEFKDKMQDILRQESEKFSLMEVDVLLSREEPVTREDFLKYACQLTLDPDTAHSRVYLSEGNQKAHHEPLRALLAPAPPHPQRFIDAPQVRSAESLNGRRYWEVELTGEDVIIALTYNNIRRTGGESEFGNNEKSWALKCSNDGYVFRHNSVKTSISPNCADRIGVYLDHSAGVLAFYGVSGAMSLLHRVQTTFTQPLFVGIGFQFVLLTRQAAKMHKPK